MKKFKVTSMICGGILSLTGSSLLAQQSSSSTIPNSSSSSSQSSSGNLGSQSSSGNLGSSSSSTYGSSSGAMHSGRNVRLSEIMHATVQSQDGKTLGHIRDVLVDPQSGRIEFAVLSPSGAGGAYDATASGHETSTSSRDATVPSSRSSVSGTSSGAYTSSMTGKLIPVPWQLFSQSLQSGFSSSTLGSSSTSSSATSSMGSHNLVVNIDESKLTSAPSIEGSDWSQLQGGSLNQRIYSHFGVDRSSAYGTSGSNVSGGTGSSFDRSNSQGTSSGSRGTSGQGSSSDSSSTTSPRSSSTDK